MNKKDHNLIAVYGSLRKECGNHPLLSESKHLSTETIEFNGHMVSLGGFPALIVDEKENNPITIEVYEVDPDTFKMVDGLEGCTTGDKFSHANFYNRKKIETSEGEAWVYYIADERHNNPMVKDGDWVNYIQNSRSKIF